MMSLRRFTWSIITRSWKHLRLRRKTNHQFSERSEQKASFIRAPNQAAHAEIANAPADPAEVALQVLETDWAALMRIQCSPVKYLSAELLAQHFVGYLRSQPPALRTLDQVKLDPRSIPLVLQCFASQVPAPLPRLCEFACADCTAASNGH